MRRVYKREHGTYIRNAMTLLLTDGRGTEMDLRIHTEIRTQIWNFKRKVFEW